MKRSKAIVLAMLAEVNKDKAKADKEELRIRKKVRKEYDEMRKNNPQASIFEIGLNLFLSEPQEEKVIDLDDECIICLESLYKGTDTDLDFQCKTGCVFHAMCIGEWLKVRRVCPSCQKEM